MRKIFICLFYGMFMVMHGNAMAESCIICADDSFGSAPSNCGSYTPYCKSDGTTFVDSTCNSCSSGYTRTSSSGKCTNMPYYSCTKSSSGGSSGGSCTTTSWTSAGTGAQSRKYCSTSTSLGVMQCRCIANYYGTPSYSGGKCTGCTPCPSDDSGNDGVSPVASTSVTACYIAANTNFTDSTGSGTYVGQCYYK